MSAVWIVKRNCSASPRLLAAVFASVAAVSFGFGAGFAAFGLWMVLPFVGVEIVAVALAFLVVARHAGDYQRIEITGDHVRVDCIEGITRTQRQWPAAWVRVSEERDDAAAPRVLIGVRGECVQIGQHLPAARRMALAAEIRNALRPMAAGTRVAAH